MNCPPRTTAFTQTIWLANRASHSHLNARSSPTCELSWEGDSSSTEKANFPITLRE